MRQGREESHYRQLGLNFTGALLSDCGECSGPTEGQETEVFLYHPPLLTDEGPSWEPNLLVSGMSG